MKQQRSVSAGAFCQRVICVCLLSIGFLASHPLAATAATKTKYTVVKTGENGSASSVTFTGIGSSGLGTGITGSSNPVISGHNVYAADMLQVSGGWLCYSGGWLTSAQTNDDIYISCTDAANSLNPAGKWTAPTCVIDNGSFNHVNDPSVAKSSSGTYYMAYTAGTTGADIHLSSSASGIGGWSAGTKLSIKDASGAAVACSLRPSLVQTPTGWSLWYDDNTYSYLAQSTSSDPNNFVVTKNYGILAFLEPDVQLRTDGAYVATYQAGDFKTIYYATSADGVNFTRTGVAAQSTDASTAFDNPSLIYDSATNTVLGVAYGSSTGDLMHHSIAVSLNQYKVLLGSENSDGGMTWHVYSSADSWDQQTVNVFGWDVDWVKITDVATGAVLVDQAFTGKVGDVWQLTTVAVPEPGAFVLLTTCLLGVIACVWRRNLSRQFVSSRF